MAAIGSEQEKKTLFLVQQRKKMDEALMKRMKSSFKKEYFKKIQKICKDNPRFLEVANTRGGMAVLTLAKVKEIYGDDPEKFEAFFELAKTRGSVAVEQLLKAKEIYGDDPEKFKIFLEIAKTGENYAIDALLKASNIYGKDMHDMEKFKMLLEMSKTEDGLNQIYTLANAKNAYGDDPEKFKIFLEILKTEDGRRRVEVLGWAKDIYGDDPVKFATFLEIVKAEKGSSRVRNLTWAKDVYGDDPAKFEIFVEIAKTGELSMENLKKILNKYSNLDFSNEINENNVLFLLMFYFYIKSTPEGNGWYRNLFNTIQVLIDKSKDLILKKLNTIRDTLSEHGKEALTDEEKTTLKTIQREGLPHYKIIERTTEYINALMESPESSTLRKSSFSLINKFGVKDKNKDKNINYSNNELASFYEKGLSLNKFNPKVFSKSLQCFDEITPDADNFAFMQETFMKNCCVWISIIDTTTTTKDKSELKEDKILEPLLTELHEQLLAEKNPSKQKEILTTFNEKVLKLISSIFESNLGLKNLRGINAETINNIKPFLTYLSNIKKHSRAKELIALFVLLKILNKWDDFKAGKDIEKNIEPYLGEKIKGTILHYLEERKELDIFKENKQEKWFETLSQKSEATLISESRSITDVMNEIQQGYAELEDPDNFDQDEKVLFENVKKFGQRRVGKALEQRYKDSSFRDESIDSLPFPKDEKSTIPKWQKIARIFGGLIKFNDLVRDSDIPQKMESLRQTLSPTPEIIEIFKKVGEDMTSSSGAKPINEDISFLESILHKKKTELSKKELDLAQAYIDKVKIMVLQLNGLRDNLSKDFAAFETSAKKTNEISERFKTRLDTFRKIFIVENQKEERTLLSTMTGDLEDVIPQIRQCLGCTSQECNNDTNLTFGDRNRFLILTREFSMSPEKSISDELVTVQLTTNGEEKTHSLIMDNVYGQRTRDILVSNIFVLINKLKALKGISPDTKMDIFVTDSALVSCGLTEEYLREKINSEYKHVQIEKQTKKITIAQSASGDGYYEIGGAFSGRVSHGSSKVNGIRVSL